MINFKIIVNTNTTCRLAETQRPRATSFSEGDDSSEDENETEEDRGEDQKDKIIRVGSWKK